jgi:hypothetical protein
MLRVFASSQVPPGERRASAIGLAYRGIGNSGASGSRRVIFIYFQIPPVCLSIFRMQNGCQTGRTCARRALDKKNWLFINQLTTQTEARHQFGICTQEMKI